MPDLAALRAEQLSADIDGGPHEVALYEHLKALIEGLETLRADALIALWQYEDAKARMEQD